MSTSHERSPDQWAPGPPDFIPGSEVVGGVYITKNSTWYTGGPEVGLMDLLYWHWHQPTTCHHCGSPPDPDGDHSCPCPTPDDTCIDHQRAFPRWQSSGLGNHTLHSLEPLHLEASLGCYDGCPVHGWIRDGRWVNVG